MLTGTQVLLLVVSETGLVYTFTTPKLQPLVTKAEGKNLIQVSLGSIASTHGVLRGNEADETVAGLSKRTRAEPRKRERRRRPEPSRFTRRTAQLTPPAPDEPAGYATESSHAGQLHARRSHGSPGHGLPRLRTA